MFHDYLTRTIILVVSSETHELAVEHSSVTFGVDIDTEHRHQSMPSAGRDFHAIVRKHDAATCKPSAAARGHNISSLSRFATLLPISAAASFERGLPLHFTFVNDHPKKTCSVSTARTMCIPLRGTTQYVGQSKGGGKPFNDKHGHDAHCSERLRSRLSKRDNTTTAAATIATAATCSHDGSCPPQ